MSDITDRIAKAPRAWAIDAATWPLGPETIFLSEAQSREFADQYQGGRVVRVALVELEEGE